MESLPLPSFSPHDPTPYSTDLCPSYYLSLLQSKIQSRFNNNIFIEDLIKDMITEISDVTTQIDRLNRNTYDDLTKLGLIQQAKWLEQLRKTQSWLITFTSDKLLYITNKYLSIKQKELGKPQEKTYCSICNKQLREAKIQQISNSLHTTSHLTPYRNIKQESDEETPYNELDLLMLQVEKSKKQLLSLNNQKTIYSLQQFLHETNHTIQVFYQDRTNFQRMQDNRDIVAILFKEFITKFMEVSNSDIKPTVIKCAEDLAEFLFRRRKDGMEFREQETQTAPWAGGGVKTMKNLEKSKSNTKDAKEAALKKNQQLLLEHKSRIEALTKENTNLEKQIKQLNTQKILSSMRMLEEDTVLQADNPPTIRPSETDTYDPSRKQPTPQNPPPPLKPDFQPMRLTDAFPSKRVTILRSSIKPNFKATEVWRDSRGSAVSSGKRSYVSHMSKGSNVSGRSNSNANRSKKFVEMMEEGGGEEEELNDLQREEDIELEMEMEEEGEIQEKIECAECGVQVDIVTEEAAVQTDEIEVIPTPREPQTPSEKSQKQQPQPQPPSALPHRSSQLTSPSLKRQFQLTRTTTDWNLSSNLHKTQILESQQLSSSSSSSLSAKILSPEELKSQSIRNELITMIAKMNLNTLKHMSNTYLKPAYGRKNKTAVGHKITIENNRSSLADTRGSFIAGKGLKPLTGISLNREDPLLKQQPLEIKGMDESMLEKDRRPQDRSKLSLRGFDPMNQTQNRFNKQRSSQKINGTFNEGKASIFNLSTPTTTTPNNTIQTRSKRQTEVISRFKTQTQTQTQTIRKNEISFDHPPERTQTQLTPNPTRTLQDHFTPHDLIHFFGSLESAFSYQSSTPTTKHKLETRFKKKHEIMISNLYTHLEEMKRGKGELYHKIKGFVKFPYQSVVNQFEGPRMESSISAGVFGNLMCYLMNLHDGCERAERKVYCEHIARLLRKLEFVSSGDKERNKDKEKQKINLPKLQQSSE